MTAHPERLDTESEGQQTQCYMESRGLSYKEGTVEEEIEKFESEVVPKPEEYSYLLAGITVSIKRCLIMSGLGSNEQDRL